MLTQDDQVTSAPRAVRVSMRTAVWMVLLQQISLESTLQLSVTYMCRQPAIRAPFRGWEALYY